MNMTVPAVASTVRCASGSNTDVQGPARHLINWDTDTSGGKLLTCNDHEICMMLLTIVCPYASGSLPIFVILNYQSFDLTLWLTKDEFDTHLFA
jgi:hypothetical protein